MANGTLERVSTSALAAIAFLALAAGCAGTPRAATASGGQTPDATPAAAPRKETPDALQPAAAGRPLAAAQEAQAEDLLREMSLTEQERKAAAAEALKLARKMMEELRYQEAEEKLESAARLDPSNEEVRKTLNDVKFILGDRGAEIRQFGIHAAEQEKVRQQQAEVELNRLFAEGLRAKDDQNYDEALRIFDQVVERVRWFQYPSGIADDLGRMAAAEKQTTAELKKNFDADTRRNLERAAREEAASERDRSKRFQDNRIKELMQAAERSYRDKRFEQVVRLNDQVLELDPNRVDARKMRRKARELSNLYRTLEVGVRTSEEWERTFLRQLESEVPYQEIFRFPSRDRWHEISSKVVNIQQRAKAGESAQDIAIRAQLQQKIGVDFDDRPFLEVLDFLRSVSTINFVLTKEARDALADADRKVRLVAKDLPIVNILTIILESGEPKFAYTIQNGAVVIGPTDAIRSETFLEFYEVSDITKQRPDFPAPKLALEAEEGGTGGGGSNVVIDLGDEGSEGDKVIVGPDVLVDLIKKTLWGGDPPEDESVEYQGGKLVVRTSLANHQKVQRLLEALRKSTGVMVTVESRFIDLQDNFLESVGINFGNPFNTNLPNPINDVDGLGTQISPGYEFVDAQGQANVRGAVFNAFSQPLGSSVAPFQISDSGGIALQYNVLDIYILEAVLEATTKRQEFKGMNAPRVTAFNTQTSHSVVIDQLAYVKDAEVNQTGVVPVINPVIGILNAGSILQVRPTVSYDRKYINLEIQPTLAEQLPSRVQRLILGLTDIVIELPVLSVTQIKTTVTVPDGGTVLVGGLKRSAEELAQVGTPWTTRLPFLDILFGRKGNSRLMSNLFVLINAKITIIRDEERLEFN
ncbi:MAG: hypothetical protein L0Z55_03815 [Planctomycetes bacterium]|nr:hypothetical protein [Planctomycetota bacterium]